MATITRFEDIKAWQAAREIVKAVYLLIDGSRLGRDFGLRDQLTRAAVSVMSNIAEGFGRNSSKEFARFLDMSRGSAAELQSLLYVANDVGYIESEQVSSLRLRIEECISMIAGLQRYLRTTSTTTPNPKS